MKRFLVLLLTLLGIGPAQAVMPPIHYQKAAEASAIKAIARVERVETVDASRRYSTLRTTFRLEKALFGAVVPETFQGVSHAVLHAWQEPGVGGTVFIQPHAGERAYVTVKEDGGGITSYTILTPVLERALIETPERIFYGITTIYTAEPVPPTPMELWRRSLATWKEIKALNGDDYAYTVLFSSWVGMQYRTRLEVRGGRVTARRYWEEYVGTGPEPALNAYVESGDQVGHARQGAVPVTLDVLYRKCGSEWLAQSEKGSKVQFLVDEGGVMQHCFHRPVGCADDCNQGVSIESIHWLSPVRGKGAMDKNRSTPYGMDRARVVQESSTDDWFILEIKGKRTGYLHLSGRLDAELVVDDGVTVQVVDARLTPLRMTLTRTLYVLSEVPKNGRVIQDLTVTFRTVPAGEIAAGILTPEAGGALRVPGGTITDMALFGLVTRLPFNTKAARPFHLLEAAELHLKKGKSIIYRGREEGLHRFSVPGHSDYWLDDDHVLIKAAWGSDKRFVRSTEGEATTVSQ